MHRCRYSVLRQQLARDLRQLQSIGNRRSESDQLLVGLACLRFLGFKGLKLAVQEQLAGRPPLSHTSTTIRRPRPTNRVPADGLPHCGRSGLPSDRVSVPRFSLQAIPLLELGLAIRGVRAHAAKPISRGSHAPARQHGARPTLASRAAIASAAVGAAHALRARVIRRPR